MSPGLIAALAVLVLLLIVFLAFYNGLVSARQRVHESWSDVDVELKRRHDLIPNLVAAVKGYMVHEREVLERLTRLRGEAEGLRPGLGSRSQAALESRITSLLGMIRMRMEAYPDLKASSNFLALQGELANTEDRIANALRYYNGNVRDLNVKCESFPGNVVAAMFGFRPAEFFKITEAGDRAVPEASVS